MYVSYIGPVRRPPGRIVLDRWQRKWCQRKESPMRFVFPEQATRWTISGKRRIPKR